jgi:hypothetical protein
VAGSDENGRCKDHPDLHNQASHIPFKALRFRRELCPDWAKPTAFAGTSVQVPTEKFSDVRQVKVEFRDRLNLLVALNVG